MWTRHHKNRKFGRLVLPAVTIAFIGYFGYHSIHGDYGLKAGEHFDVVRAERSKELATLIHDRKKLETQVKLLSDGSLERDMIDEKARYQLNMSRPDEIVIFNR
ncbi:FtsB family cell division protein [Agrobacterium vitis]|uniref:FtsB family cell division protein n=1 Tax=Agrobacterium vitis TaxID=373 RepID=UPI0015716701|nr:septum formation initiator family protein [Agrobacterium vitis]MCF1453189.1 septum formation initiator family protein [Agrobacterium vitis]NSZ16695.1 septum formation initiator family protein [Agrobacterium vitis]QZO05450.1 septum formation initiator family protein [Agrobacterium vitis]UJL87596.1 septum formation initiator family protein [Agrobacterium vitis]BCH54266.1 cell division protein [Agrobacterium vitis]